MLNKCIAREAVEPINYFLGRAEKDFRESIDKEEKQNLFSNSVMLKRLQHALELHIYSAD